MTFYVVDKVQGDRLRNVQTSTKVEFVDTLYTDIEVSLYMSGCCISVRYATYFLCALCATQHKQRDYTWHKNNFINETEYVFLTFRQKAHDNTIIYTL